MKRDVYITNEERVKCRRVARAFAELEAERGMDLNLFKDRIFEFLNGDDCRDIADIDTDDSNDMFKVTMINGRMFEVQCREIG